MPPTRPFANPDPADLANTPVGSIPNPSQPPNPPLGNSPNRTGMANAGRPGGPPGEFRAGTLLIRSNKHLYCIEQGATAK